MLRYLAVFGIILGVLSFTAAPEPADARPQYIRVFAKTYPKLMKKILKKKCLVCHYTKDRKKHNDYGNALKKYFGEKENIKDPKEIKKGIKAIEKEKSSVKGKTFGDLIKAGKLPGTPPKKKDDK